MDDNQELRRNWRTNWLGSIQEFADLQTQQRRWLDPGEANLHFQFVEYFCCYFDDLALSEMGGYDGAVEAGLVTRPEADAVAEFHEVARSYKSPKGVYDPAAVLNDPNWGVVENAAQRAQSALLGLIDEPSEILALTNSSAF